MTEPAPDLRTPPPTPWTKGSHEAYSAFSLTVDVCQDEFDRVWSSHCYETPEDEAVALQLKSGGAPQVAYALLTEAMRREAFVLTLVRMSKDPDFIQTYKTASDEVKRGMEADLGIAARQIMANTMSKMVAGVGREILSMVASE